MRALLYLMAILCGLSFWQMPTHDPDLGWHLIGGSLTLSNGAVPRVDPINTFSTLWLDYHWLGQVLLFKVYSLWGFEGLRVLLGLSMAIVGYLLMRLIECFDRSDSHPLSCLLSFVICFSLIGEVVSVRPHVFLLIILLIAILLLRRKPSRVELPILFCLAAIGANVHVYWILLPFLWGLYRCLPRLFGSDLVSPLYAWGGFFVILLAGFISPYGIFTSDPTPGAWFANYTVLFDYTVMPSTLRSFINELKPGMAADEPIPYLLIFVLILFAKNVSLKKDIKRIGDIAGAAFSFLLTLRAIKFVALLGVFGAPLVIDSLLKLTGQTVKPHFRVNKQLALGIVVLCCVLFGFKAYAHAPWLEDNSFYMTESLPIDACTKIEELHLTPKHQRDHLRVLTHFNYGGWCRWLAYEKSPNFKMKVTTDGRTQLVPAEHYQKSFDLYRLKGEWAKTLVQWEPDVVLVEKSSALAQILVRAPAEWKLVHEDGSFALFIPIS